MCRVLEVPRSAWCGNLSPPSETSQPPATRLWLLALSLWISILNMGINWRKDCSLLLATPIAYCLLLGIASRAAPSSSTANFCTTSTKSNIKLSCVCEEGVPRVDTIKVQINLIDLFVCWLQTDGFSHACRFGLCRQRVFFQQRNSRPHRSYVSTFGTQKIKDQFMN